ncbi:alpha/beta hydrolase fold domain-containing protein [Saccharibacillus alkalitolerans]|uniref:Alpha/beta hydrolase n=1 Tax=Saccharibacillus alkalitolerans TaxID=2705290 RepID=A0ABX0F472_9BACL|nr:alpha/beta hydrolase [Saccharibacillus alkalitolerans]NGZ74799.1 alpha/beta hydrolase [Saccharibacillus alkalitolerans]
MRQRTTGWIFAALARLSVYRKIYDDEERIHRYIAYRGRQNARPYKPRGRLKTASDVDFIRRGGMDGLLLRRPDRIPGRHILYLHGSAYVMQPNVFQRRFFLKLGRIFKAEVLMPIYPKAPGTLFEEATEKFVRIYEELLAEIEPEQIVIAGDSSGGASALVLAQALYERGLPQPGRLLMVSPVLDSTMTNPGIAALEPDDPLQTVLALRELGRAWAGKENLDHPGVSPIYGPLGGLADMILVVGTSDILMPDARRLKEAAEAAGNGIRYFEYEGMMHDFPLLPIPEARRVLEEIEALLYR